MNRYTLPPLALPLLAGCSIAFGQANPEQFAVYWHVSGYEGRSIDLGDAPVRTDLRTIDKSHLGNYPKAGPHIIEGFPEGREAYIAAHVARIEQDLLRSYCVPDVDYSGFAVIDFENWMPFWTFHPNVPSSQSPEAIDSDWKDDWKDFIRQNRPQLLAGLNAEQQEVVFRDTWIEVGSQFFLATLNECKRLRPNARWGFYNLPSNPYWPWVTDYGTHGEYRRAMQHIHDEELSWLHPAVDAYFPCFYTPYESVPNPVRHTPFDSYEQNTAYFANATYEFVRIAQGKPVIPYVWYLYHRGGNICCTQFLNDFNLENMIRAPLNAGASGVAIWGWLPSVEEEDRVQDYFDTKVTPVWSRIHHEIQPPAPPPPPPPPPPPGGENGGGSGGGGSSGGGSSGGGSSGGGSSGGGSSGGGSGGGGSSGGGSSGGGSGGGGSSGGGSGGGAGSGGSGGSGGGSGEGGNSGGGSGGSGGGGSGESGGSGGSSGGGSGVGTVVNTPPSGGGSSGGGSGSGGSGGGSSGGSGGGSGGGGSGGGSNTVQGGSSGGSSGGSTSSGDGRMTRYSRMIALTNRNGGSGSGGSSGSGAGGSSSGGSTPQVSSNIRLGGRTVVVGPGARRLAAPTRTNSGGSGSSGGGSSSGGSGGSSGSGSNAGGSNSSGGQSQSGQAMRGGSSMLRWLISRGRITVVGGDD